MVGEILVLDVAGGGGGGWVWRMRDGMKNGRR